MLPHVKSSHRHVIYWRAFNINIDIVTYIDIVNVYFRLSLASVCSFCSHSPYCHCVWQCWWIQKLLTYFCAMLTCVIFISYSIVQVHCWPCTRHTRFITGRWSTLSTRRTWTCPLYVQYAFYDLSEPSIEYRVSKVVSALSKRSTECTFFLFYFIQCVYFSVMRLTIEGVSIQSALI